MNQRLTQSIHFKIASGVIATTVILSALYFVWDYRFHRRQLLNELRSSATELSNVTLQALLELAMLGRHPELLQAAIERLGSVSPVSGILLLDRSGIVRFSSNAHNLGRHFDRTDPGCRECHSETSVEAETSLFYQLPEGNLLRSVRLVPNRVECHSCHDPSQQFNGILVVDFHTSGINQKLRADLYEMLIKAGLTIFGILLVLGLLMNKVIIVRLKQLSRATTLLARQWKNPRLKALAGPDEIGQLATSFDRMASKVESSFHELQSQKAYLQELIDSLQDGLIVVDRDLRIELANRTAHRAWNIDQQVRPLLEDTSLQLAREAVLKTLDSGELTRKEVKQSESDSPSFLELYCSPVRTQDGDITGVIILIRDVTERKRFESQISRAERLASIGQLAAGFAHEINNPMAAVATCAEGLGRHLETADSVPTTEKEEIKDYLATIGEAALRCKEITQRLLSLSADHGEVEFRPVDLAEIAHHTITLVEHEAENRGIRLNVNARPSTFVLGDPEKLSQLLLNLLLNSLEAVPDLGKIEVSLDDQSHYVGLEVSDDGCGISEEDLEKIFDPFFTSKSGSRGTGLGLSISEGIVRQHQGKIFVSSRKGRGTKVAVLFPRMED